MCSYAFVTMVTTDYYLAGALAVVAALKDVHFSLMHQEVAFEVACLITPHTLSMQSINLLQQAFDAVFGVDEIQQDDLMCLNLLGRCFTSYHYLLLLVSNVKEKGISN